MRCFIVLFARKTRTAARKRFPARKENARGFHKADTQAFRGQYCFRFNFVAPAALSVPLDELYFSGSRFTTGEIPFVNLTSDSYKFFRVSRRGRRWMAVSHSSPHARRRRKYFRDRGILSLSLSLSISIFLFDCIHKELQRKRRNAATRDATGVCIQRSNVFAPDRTSESLYIDLLKARFKPGSVPRITHVCQIPDVVSEEYISDSQIRNLGGLYFKFLYENRRFYGSSPFRRRAAIDIRR